MCSLSDAPQRPWSFKGLERVTITFMFFRDFALWIWLEKNDRNTRHAWISLGPSWLPVEIQPPSFRVRWLCHSQATFEERVEERVFGQRAVWSKGHGNHTGQEETRVITCFFALLLRTITWRWSEALVVRLAPDAPGDNQFVYTSLSPEPIHPCDSPRFFLLGKVDMTLSC